MGRKSTFEKTRILYNVAKFDSSIKVGQYRDLLLYLATINIRVYINAIYTKQQKYIRNV